jgi:GxxExxY protein
MIFTKPEFGIDKHSDTGEQRMILRQETEKIVGCAFEVLNELGHGLIEKPYENALVVEFGLQSIPCQQQRRFDVLYKTVKVGEYVPDLIVFRSVVVDTKVIDCITDHELGQMLNYLKITGLRVGLILNFRRAKLEWKRVVQ